MFIRLRPQFDRVSHSHYNDVSLALKSSVVDRFDGMIFSRQVQSEIHESKLSQI